MTSGGEETADRRELEWRAASDGGSGRLGRRDESVQGANVFARGREGQRHAGLAQREKWIRRGGDDA